MQNLSKRIIAILIIAIMVVSAVAPCCLAESTGKKKSAIYFLPSYSATRLYDSETGELAWGNSEYMGKSIIEYAKTGEPGETWIGLDENYESKLVVDMEKDAEAGLYSIECMPGEGVSDKMMEYLIDYAASVSTANNPVEAKFFGYDWRLSAVDSAELLREDIKNNGYTNVSFVCHSAGGFVCAKFVADNNKAPIVTVDKVITLGTPMQGTYAALVALESGEVDLFLNGINMLYDYGIAGTIGGIGVNILAQNLFFPWITENLRNTALTYELMPSSSYMEQYPAYIVDTSKIIPENKEVISSPARFAQIIKNSDNDLNKNLADGEKGYLNFWERELGASVVEIFATVDSYHIAGTGSQTSISARYEQNDDGAYSFYGTRKSNDGDGLATLASALGIYYDASGREIKPENYNTFDGVDHMALVSNDEVIAEVLRFLSANPAKKYVPQTGVKELSSANTVNSSISDIIDAMESTDKNIEVRLSGDVDIVIKNSYGEEIGKIIDGIPDTLVIEHGIVLEYIDSDTDTLALYFPGASYKIEFYKRNDASVSLVSIIMNALIDNGIILDSAAYELEVGDGENIAISLDAKYSAENTDGQHSATNATVTKVGTEKVTLEADRIKTNYVKKIKLGAESMLLKLADNKSLCAKAYPETSNVNYKSSNEKVICVDENGGIKAVGEGCAFVTAYSDDGNALENCFVTVLEELKLVLQEGSLLEWGEEYIENIDVKTSVSQLASNFLSLCVRITDEYGIPVEVVTDPVGTGFKIQLVIGEDILDEIIAVVTGDADGNGLLNSRDVSSAQKHMFEIETLNGAYLKAADMNDDDIISSRDIARMQKGIFA